MQQKSLQEEFLALYEPVQQRISGYCRVIAGDNELAKDLLSETILAVYSNFHRIRNREVFVYYMFGTASRIFKKHLRKKRLASENAPYFQDCENDPERKDDLEFLYYLLRQLPFEQKQALILFEINGFSIREVSQMTGVTESAVKSRLARGRERLCFLLKKTEKKNEIIREAGYGKL